MLVVYKMYGATANAKASDQCENHHRWESLPQKCILSKAKTGPHHNLA